MRNDLLDPYNATVLKNLPYLLNLWEQKYAYASFLELPFPEYVAMAYQSQVAEPEDHLSGNIHSAH